MQSPELTTAIESATAAAEAFNAQMKKLFPGFLSRAVVKNILGKVVQIEFANVADASECPSGILMNATGHMRFLMQMCDSRGQVLPTFDIDQLMRGYPRDKGPKFRKIKGKTPEAALKKLAEWFEKNKTVIHSL